MNTKWFKKMFSWSFSPKAGRIVYSLPNPSKFKKYYNKTEPFKDVNWTDWSRVIDGFEKRFSEWYFDNMHAGQSAYLDLCSLCALAEAFTHYSNGKDWHDQNNYKEFLRRLDPVFRKHLSTPITVSRFVADRWTESKLKDFADVFYTGVRCSLHHHGDLASFAGMAGTGKIALEIANAGTSICGRFHYPIVVFDPHPLKDAMRNWLKKYCDKLRINPTSDEAQLFKTRFLNDFGITVL